MVCMPKSRYFTLLLLASALALLPARGAPGALRIALLPNAEVQGDAILLGSLLPDTAPAAIHSIANTITLGKTPQPGTTRYLQGAAIAAVIERAGFAASRFSIPEVVAVQRAGRLLTSAEVAAAVGDAIGRFSLAPAAAKALLALRCDDFTWESAVRVPLGSAQLKVTGILINPVEGRARFRVRAQNEKASLPFDVLARFTTEKDFVKSAGAPAVQREVRNEVPRGERREQIATFAEEHSDGPVLVAAGHAARLHLHSENSSMLLDVKALQPGHLGETIRVRLPLTGKTLQARVVGERALDAFF
jgi:hypothetical protein